MSEFRQNYATKEWVIIAPERAKRPKRREDAADNSTEKPSYSTECPFCPGNEGETGVETMRCGDAFSWRVRAVRNKYSALDPSRSVERRRRGRFLVSDSFGDAEVVIESPIHNASLADMDAERISEILYCYRERALAIGAMRNVAIYMIFRNHGSGAGTSLEHPHSQIIASPIIPPHIRDPFQKAALHYDSYGSCVYCDMIEEEISQAERIVTENDQFVVFCPFASRTPYEIRIYPRRHAASYSWITDEEIPAFARVLRESLRKLRILSGDPSYNFIIRSAPIGDEDVRYLHWYFVLIPKINTPAGFEIGSGIFINPSSPEECARQLREA